MKPLPLLDEKITYFRKCCQIICKEWALKYDLTREQEERVFYRLSRKTNYFSIGTNYIWNFVTYGFFKKQSSRRFVNFKFSWITSTTAVNDWIDKEDDWFVYHGRWLAENKLSKPPEHTVNINPRNTEETFRKKFHNSLRGFITCMENTSLIDPESRYCRLCFNKVDCKKLLETNNPDLFIERYGRTE